jgi:hypothetical protein
MALMSVMVTFGYESRDQIARCLKTTLELFLQTEFPFDTASQDSIAWNQAVVKSLQALNDTPQELFIVCFDETTSELLPLIRASSAEIRKQVSTALQRKFF